MIGTGIFTSLGLGGDCRVVSPSCLDGGWNLRDVRRALLCRIGGGVAALRGRIPFSPRDLSSVARISRRLDLGYGWLLGARRDRRNAIRHLPSRNFPINKSAGRRDRIRLIGHIRPVVRPPTRKRFPDRVHHSQGGVDRSPNCRRFFRGKDANNFIFADQGRYRRDRERAVRDQFLLGDVCLLRLERFHLSPAKFVIPPECSALTHLRHNNRDHPLCLPECSISPNHPRRRKDR